MRKQLSLYLLTATRTKASAISQRTHCGVGQLSSLRDFAFLEPASQPSARSFFSRSYDSRCGPFAGEPVSLAKRLGWAQLTRHTVLEDSALRSTQLSRLLQASCYSTKLSASRNARGSTSQSKAAQQGLYLVAIVVGMVGVTYGSVPLYRMFCQATGYGGTVQQGDTVEEKLRQRADAGDSALEAAAAERELTVSFNADVTDGMNWRFVPTQRSVRIHPGQSTLAFYTAHNLSDRAVTGVSTYNVSPQQAGFYFNKIQCFCFEEQKLRPGEKIDMPVFFYIDPEFATDPRMKGVDHLTLSYTFFKVAEEDAESTEAIGKMEVEADSKGSQLGSEMQIQTV